MKRLTKTALCSGLALAVAAAGLIAYQAYTYLHTPLCRPGQSTIIRIETGTSFGQVVRQLAREGILQEPWKFRLLGTISGKAQAVKAGEFRIDTGWRPQRLLRSLVEGDEVLHRLQVPEGLTWWETARIVERTGLGTFEGFRRAVHDTELLREFDIPADTAEGYLFPETYMLPRPKENGARTVVRIMLRQFREQTSRKLWPEGRPDPEAVHRLVTLASLVEKETGVAQERPRIAGVFQNRLERGMRLQCDPTVIYGMGRDFDGNLQKPDLRDRSNEYNTYRHPGLPPGPICSPGLASLRAAQNPEDHAYLYFVSKGDGSHKFSRTLREHNRAVRRFQLN
jgi:UPF0755 protein